MALNAKQLGETFFAEVTGVDLTRKLEDDTYREINDLLLQYGVLLFPDQPLTDEAQEVFSRWYGDLEVTFNDDSKFTAHLSNVEDDGTIRDPESRQSSFLRANQQWHSDSTIFAAPARISFLSAREVPPVGGETEWADMQAAWEALPEALKQEFDGLIVEHDFQNSRRKAGHEFDEEQRKRWPPLPHPLVRTHEETGKKALYVGSQAVCVIGWPFEKGEALIEELLEFATQPRFVHTHTWTQYDFVMWDNRRVNHRGRPWDEAKYSRALHRTTVKGTGPTMADGMPVDEYVREQETHALAFLSRDQQAA